VRLTSIDGRRGALDDVSSSVANFFAAHTGAFAIGLGLAVAAALIIHLADEENAQQRKTLLTGGFGFLMVLCCLAGPAVIGAIGGAAIGGVLGVAAAVVIALAVAAVIRWRSKTDRSC
jgi:hypothetical protein